MKIDGRDGYIYTDIIYMLSGIMKLICKGTEKAVYSALQQVNSTI